MLAFKCLLFLQRSGSPAVDFPIYHTGPTAPETECPGTYICCGRPVDNPVDKFRRWWKTGATIHRPGPQGPFGPDESLWTTGAASG